MQNVIAVIGAGFGDEGKGRMVDHFASQGPCIVVRYNGGAQAAHTVVRNGKRYAFHHFGAGTAAGAPTYLSKFFLVNPLLWSTEATSLAHLSPSLFVDPDAIVTTPYDMFINRELAEKGSTCGYGINETVTRFLSSSKYRLRVHELQGDVRPVLKRIRDEWVPSRVKSPSKEFTELVRCDNFIDAFIDCSKAFLAAAKPMTAVDLSKYSTVIFEGAQGLLLDEQHEFFPYVTRSRTGLHNIKQILQPTEVVYVTRAYMTRHGAGPFPTEDKQLAYPDATNKPNDYQGAMRFGWLDLDLIKATIEAPKFNVALTCYDQVGDVVKYRWRGKDTVCPKADLPGLVKRLLGASKIYVSSRP
jgi:adenylosuccinate synthase